jgi:hypothetical protein
MKHLTVLYSALVFIICLSCNSPKDSQSADRNERTDSLPDVLPANHADFIEGKLKLEAILKFAEKKLPDNLKDWEIYRVHLKNEIIEKAEVIVAHKLPLNIRETGSIQLKGYKVKNITFQTRPGVYATANLYIPDGSGPFPGVINMPGHWTKAKTDTAGPQAVGHSLALNGYVCLTVDPWGAGERSTHHAVFEYHGSNLGASLMNIGEPLIGIQISDNIRGVDLLCSLPEVDSANIGATGASGGGNQTMWLAAADERIKAAVPVVSVGTFESYVMRSNCICELLIDGLTFTEEAGVLALSRAIMPCNHIKDGTTFSPAEMLRSYNNAKLVFEMMGVENNISCKVFDLTHGYMAEDREAMLGWFDLHLKGTGTGNPKKEIPFKQLPEEKLMVFPAGQRDTNVLSTDEYCRRRGTVLRTAYLKTRSFDIDQKTDELKNILRINEKPELRKVHQLSSIGGWDRFVLETSDDKLIPVLHLAPVNKSIGYVILCNSEGKNRITLSLIDELKNKGSGIVIIDLSGTGEVTSSSSFSYDNLAKLHTLSRANLWIGKTVLGEWVKELDIVIFFLHSRFKTYKVSIDGSKEAGLAGLFLSATGGNVDNIILRDAPVSYLFDNRESVDFFSMGIHLPGFLNWGDVSLAAALTGENVVFINPVTMSGGILSTERLKEFQTEFDNVRKICRKKGMTDFYRSQAN